MRLEKLMSIPLASSHETGLPVRQIDVNGTNLSYVERGREIALVLTDMAMPFMDGAATIRALRKFSPQLKIIAASGLMNAEQTADLQALKVSSFLSKPYTAEKLLTTIAEVLAEK